jgi:ectoine hydroxylase-related dioxygenase (phytanoyl-CoA dioxygenase family)
MKQYQLTPEQITAFQRDGYVLVPTLFSSEEIDLIRNIAHADAHLAQNAVDRHDKTGNTTRISLKNQLGDDIYSAIARSERIVSAMETLLEDEVYHYHHKMTMKEPYVGGAWEWHQDYGYWYNNGCLFPDMASVMIAVDRSTKENGCLQVLRGSHKMGRIEHGKVADQTGANLERVEQALKRLDLVYAEMSAGDALFFHSNTLHRSDANLSPDPRWTLICCYNTKHNDPYKEHHHPNYHPLERWDDARVLEVARREIAELRSAGVLQ